MKVNGVVALYKKNYLGDDHYRFDYVKNIYCTLDNETGLIEDDFGNQYPYIRSINFLESKDVYAHNGFMPLDMLKNKYGYEEEGIEGVLHLYEVDAKNRVPFVKVVNDPIMENKGTVVSELHLDELAKQAITFYTDYPSKDGEYTGKSEYKFEINGTYEDIAKAVRAGEFDLHDLKMIKDKYSAIYEELHALVKDCELYENDLTEGVFEVNLENRDPNFSFGESVSIDTLYDMMNDGQLTLEEVQMIYANFYPTFEQLDALMNTVDNEIRRVENILNSEDVSDDTETKKEVFTEEDLGEFSLDDLKGLRTQIKEYLVGQDDALRELTAEISRMNDKDLNDNVGILLTGGSGTGKTFMVELIAKYLGLPFIRVDSTSLTVPGYIGRDLEEEIYRLYEVSGKDVEKAQCGIVFFDEIDKKGSNSKDDVSGQGVLNHLLTLLDGVDIYAVKSTKSMMPGEEVKINTKNMIVIAAGSFPDVYIENKEKHIGFGSQVEEKKDDGRKTPKTEEFVKKAFMSRDFMNRFPTRIRLNDIKEDDFVENYEHGEDSPIKWEIKSFKKNGVDLRYTPEFVRMAAKRAIEENSGFRGSKGVILNATRYAYDYIKENDGEVDEILLEEETVDNPKVYKKFKGGIEK